MSAREPKETKTVNGREPPEPATIAGYGALISNYGLSLPIPAQLIGIAERHHPPAPTSEWRLLTPRHAPGNSLRGHLEFALKYEGVNLAVLNALFATITEADIVEVIREKPTGGYSRRLWFLYEWLTGSELDVPELGKVRSVPVVDPKLQAALTVGTLSSRHKVVDNLPGTPAFCPMVRLTDHIREFLAMELDVEAREVVGRIHSDNLLTRASAQLLLADSRSSFLIEGESPSPKRAQRWGVAIADAGKEALTIPELERLQELLIEDSRFVSLGLRTEGGFIGDHDRRSREPIPQHISARHEDLEDLVTGVLEFSERAVSGHLDAVISAACVAFGFVYIHPFVDANGRIHRWLFHHELARADYTPRGFIFPVSSAILRNPSEYKRVLESYSRPLLPLISWDKTPGGNVTVLGQTVDFYRYFDATEHAEFLFECVQETIRRDLPQQVQYLEAFDRFKVKVEEIVDMPQALLDLLNQVLRQGRGKLSKKKRENQFELLEDLEVQEIEKIYQDCFEDVPEEAFEA